MALLSPKYIVFAAATTLFFAGCSKVAAPTASPTPASDTMMKEEETAPADAMMEKNETVAPDSKMDEAVGATSDAMMKEPDAMMEK